MNGARKTAVSGGFTNLKILISGKWSFEKSKFQDIRSFTKISNYTLYHETETENENASSTCTVYQKEFIFVA